MKRVMEVEQPSHYTVNDIVLRGIIAISKLLKPQPTVKKIVENLIKKK